MTSAFTRHAHDKYSFKTKGQKPPDNEILKVVSFQADPHAGHFSGGHDSIIISISLIVEKNGVNPDSMCALL